MGLGLALFCLRPATLEHHTCLQQRTKDHEHFVLSHSLCAIGFMVRPICKHIHLAHLG